MFLQTYETEKVILNQVSFWWNIKQLSEKDICFLHAIILSKNLWTQNPCSILSPLVNCKNNSWVVTETIIIDQESFR